MEQRVPVAERLTVGNDGWVRYRSDELPAVYVRLAPKDDGRLAMTELYLADDDTLDVNRLRRIPLGRIEAWANGSGAQMIRDRLGIPGPDLRRAVGYFKTTWGEAPTEERPPRHWVEAMYWAQFDDAPVPQAPEAKQRRSLGRRSVVPDLRLVPPADRDRGDDFYRQVAEAYSAAALIDRGPAVAIAQASDVPVTTVHRWVKEARRRGFLSAGRPGKAG
jgi:hypothetical protein